MAPGHYSTLILNVAGAAPLIMVIGRRVETYCFGDPLTPPCSAYPVPAQDQ
jgi:hypothetical protein